MTEKAYEFILSDFTPVVPRTQVRRNKKLKESTSDITITLNKNGSKTPHNFSARVSFHNGLKSIVSVFDKVEPLESKNKPDSLAFIFYKSDPDMPKQKGLFKLQKRGGTFFVFTMTADVDKRFRKKFINRDFDLRVISCDSDQCTVHAWPRKQEEE